MCVYKQHGKTKKNIVGILDTLHLNRINRINNFKNIGCNIKCKLKSGKKRKRH